VILVTPALDTEVVLLRKNVDYRRTDLCADHIVPIAERPDLAHDELNITVRCRSCNGRRGDTCTDAERQQVLDAIEARKQRLARYYVSQA
jgi:hypothetical protein